MWQYRTMLYVNVQDDVSEAGFLYLIELTRIVLLLFQNSNSELHNVTYYAFYAR